MLTDEEVNAFTLLKNAIGVADLVRSGSNLSSRVVENLFWFGRYSERCEDVARILRVGLSRLVDTGTEAMPALLSTYDLCRSLKLLPGSDAEADGGKRERADQEEVHRPELESRMLAAISDDEWQDGLAGNIRRLLWVGSQVREHFSLDNWHALNRLQHHLQVYSEFGREIGDALAFLDQILLSSSSLAGFAMDNMTRDDGWRFLFIGRRIERLIFLSSSISQFLRLESTRARGVSVAARIDRQHHHLPVALHDSTRTFTRARSDRFQRGQSARGVFPVAGPEAVSQPAVHRAR